MPLVFSSLLILRSSRKRNKKREISKRENFFGKIVSRK
ncbi:hypothetical protein HMPREF9012_0045 [Bacteroidetes bacterium oral taxon 272 str. F0290]|nr:hypothetical protein HMPREF9012_0045 [Bacteroidetes bacterium oral taxon 272 str. F0290]